MRKIIAILGGVAKTVTDYAIDIKSSDFCFNEFLSVISMSVATVSRRIQEMADDIFHQKMDTVKNSLIGYALQVDESTDISNNAKLVCHARLVRIKKEILCLKPLSEFWGYFSQIDTFLTRNELSFALQSKRQKWLIQSKRDR